jgi:hypothetical protein
MSERSGKRSADKKQAMVTLIVFGIALAVIALVAFVFARSNPLNTPISRQIEQKSRPSVKIAEVPVSVKPTWRKLVADAVESCKEAKDCSIDFDAQHQYNGRYFGVMVVGWVNSEYEIELYRYDVTRRDWISSPRSEGEITESVDVAVTSRAWHLPRPVIEKWLKEAEDAAHMIYNAE